LIKIQNLLAICGPHPVDTFVQVPLYACCFCMFCSIFWIVLYCRTVKGVYSYLERRLPYGITGHLILVSAHSFNHSQAEDGTRWKAGFFQGGWLYIQRVYHLPSK